MKDALQLLPLVLKSGAGVQGQDPVVFLCFFKHSIPTRSRHCLWQFIPQSATHTHTRLRISSCPVPTGTSSARLDSGLFPSQCVPPRCGWSHLMSFACESKQQRRRPPVTVVGPATLVCVSISLLSGHESPSDDTPWPISSMLFFDITFSGLLTLPYPDLMENLHTESSRAGF